MAASKVLLSTLVQIRPIQCCASYHTRIVSHPPDLLKWVKREGGFVHQSVKISPQQPDNYGIGLVAADDIPKGSLLISLPIHLPLKVQTDDVTGADSVLLDLARRVPGN